MIARRRVVRDGKPLSFSCQTAQFRTDVNRGKAHGTYSPTLGSAFDRPLVDRYGYTLWLELVAPAGKRNGGYWFVWYDPFGMPTLMPNGVLEKSDIIHIKNMLGAFG